MIIMYYCMYLHISMMRVFFTKVCKKMPAVPYILVKHIIEIAIEIAIEIEMKSKSKSNSKSKSK